jgi:hypothetical protein
MGKTWREDRRGKERRSCMLRQFVYLFGAVALFLSGCGGGGSDVGFVYTQPNGTLRIWVTDKQSDDFEHVVVSVKEIRVVPSGKEGLPDTDKGLPVIATFPVPESIDIMSLHFQQELLGSGVIPAGTYTQVRLILEPNPSGSVEPVNYVILKSEPGTKYPLKTPSGQQSGLKVLGRFTVEKNVIRTIVLDFDPNTAIVTTGSSEKNQKFILKPTGIRIVQPASDLTRFGSLSGTVSAAASWASAIVSVVPPGSTTAVASGEIFSEKVEGQNLWQAPFTSFVPAGQYRVHVQAPGFAPYSTAIATVAVEADTPLGVLTLKPAP